MYFQILSALLLFSFVNAQTTAPTCPIPDSTLMSIDTSPITNGCSDYSGGATTKFCSDCICGFITVSVNAFILEAQTTGTSWCSMDPSNVFGLCEAHYIELLVQDGILTTGMLTTLGSCSTTSFDYTTCTSAINTWNNWYTTNCGGATSAPTDAPTSTSAPTDTPTGTSAPTDTPTGTSAPTDAPTGTSAPTDAPTGTSAPTSAPTTPHTSGAESIISFSSFAILFGWLIYDLIL
jgi:hypothetical protein